MIEFIKRLELQNTKYHEALLSLKLSLSAEKSQLVAKDVTYFKFPNFVRL